MVDVEGMITYLWMAAVLNHFFLATFIYPKKSQKIATREIDNIRACLQSAKYVKPEFRNIVLANRRYNLFMAANLAVIELRNKA